MNEFSSVDDPKIEAMASKVLSETLLTDGDVSTVDHIAKIAKILSVVQTC